MSILIKGMGMPKNCFDCEIFGLCSLKDRLEHIKDRNPDCPLIEIPTPHGRLIDVDELLDDIGLEDCDYNRDVNMGEIITLESIDRITTVIEAEE